MRLALYNQLIQCKDIRRLEKLLHQEYYDHISSYYNQISEEINKQIKCLQIALSRRNKQMKKKKEKTNEAKRKHRS